MRKHWQDYDNFLKATRRGYESYFSPSFVFMVRGPKNFEDLLRDCQRAAEQVSVFRKSLNVLHNSQSTQPAVITFLFHVFHLPCLGGNPVIDLWLCSSVKAFFFLLIKCFDWQNQTVKCWKLLLFKCKIHLRLSSGNHSPNTVLTLFESSSCEKGVKVSVGGEITLDENSLSLVTHPSLPGPIYNFHSELFATGTTVLHNCMLCWPQTTMCA